MDGMATHTGISGVSGWPPVIQVAMGARKNICMRYMPKVSCPPLVKAGEPYLLGMQENIRKAPNVLISRFGVQNSHDHSKTGVSMSWPGVPSIQNDHAVKLEPIRKHRAPITNFFL